MERLTDLESSVLSVRDPKSRENIKEAINAYYADELKQQSETLKGLSGTVLEDIMIKQPCDAELHKVA